MTTAEWSKLSKEQKERLIDAVFNSSYLAVTHAEKNPANDGIIKAVLSYVTLNGNMAYINIQKKIKL